MSDAGILIKQAVDAEALGKISARLAAYYGVMPLAVRNGALRLAVPVDFNRQNREELRIMLGFELEFVTASRCEIEDLISKYYGVGAGVIETLTQDQKQNEEVYDFEVIDQGKGEDATITKLVNALFTDAVKCRASDIHIEPFERMLRIRYRVDGLLQDARIPDRIRMLASNLISRIKIMAKLDIGEKRQPQDGRIKIRLKGEEMDLRVSVLPSSFGEAVVIRILKPLALLELGELGFDRNSTAQMRHLLTKPNGVVLITGPTGSGKTTTLYACLRELNRTEVKIITIEDPIEYKLPGVIQMQVNPKIDFTFAKALRSILRHDPDCIMVGEIRDPETAEIAVRSALTGHLVFSTLHTNDAPSAVTRLVEMGVEPYLVASSLRAVAAQRLVRRFCGRCRGTKDSECPVCLGTGYRGRLAISELMQVNDAIRDLVLRHRTGSVIRKEAVRNGMTGIDEDGRAKARLGLTSDQEIERVIC